MTATASRAAALSRASVALLLAAACRGRDDGALLPAAAAGAERPAVRTSGLQAGGETRDVAARNPYAGDAIAIQQGRELYEGMNCAGCHGPAGGGGIGPPFADDEWIYGDDPENVVQSILQGRPNGMPAFAGRLPVEGAWRIAAYVELLNSEGMRKGTPPGEPTVRRGGGGAR